MENTGKKVTSFVKEVVARITGDGAEATAQKVGRKAMSALESQVAALKAQLVDDETRVEDAEEALNVAIYPTEMFRDNRAYCANIARAQANLDEAVERKTATEESIVFFKTLLKENF